MDWSQRQIRVFRALLYCYPAEFRHEYATEMERLFADRLTVEPQWRLWADTIADVATTALREHASILIGDTRHGVNVFASQPWFTAITLLVMATGIAASVSVFSLCNAVLFRSLPYLDPDRLVYLWSPNHRFKGVPDELGPNLADFVEWQKRSRSFMSIASFESDATRMVGKLSTSRLQAATVSGRFFETLGVAAQLGRVIAAGDDQAGGHPVVDISDRLWRSAFGADANAIGKVVQFDRAKATVIGVMPPGFGFPIDGDVLYEQSLNGQTDVWRPAAYTEKQKADRTDLNISVDAIARLRPGVSPRQAERELQVLQSGVQRLYPPVWRGFSALVRPLVDTIIGPVRQMFWLLLGAAGLVLLIAIANSANLLLARTAARAHELGIRTALGAERGRIMRQLLTESVLLSSAGGLLGVGLSYGLVHVLVKLNPGGIPRFGNADIDRRVLLFAVLVSLVAGCLAGLAPAWLARKVNVNTVLRAAGKGIATGFVGSRFALITAEIALSVVLLSSAGLLLRSYLNLASKNTGFSAATLTFAIPLDDRYNTPDKVVHFYADALQRFQRIPGVRYAGGTDAVPLTQRNSVSFVDIAGVGRIKEMLQNRFVTPDYRKAIGATLLAGRDLSTHDLNPKDAGALVNAAFVNRYLRGRAAIGMRFRMGMENDFGNWFTIAGVVGDISRHNLDEPAQPEMWLPFGRGGEFAIASNLPARQLMPEVRSVLHSMDPILSVEDVRTMRERITASNARRTFQTALLTGFSAIALALALAGLYGLMSYLVRQRTAEVGLRLALGCPRRRVIAMITAQGMRVAVAGVAIGLACSFATTRVLQNWLFEVKPADPLTFAGVALMILAVAIGGCVVPAWSATRIDPVEALRQE